MSGRTSSPPCGILNVDKPLGYSSHEVVVVVRKLLSQDKVGHAGTLDPLATGVLLLCLGKATRVSQFLMDSHKTYRAAVRLGVSTTTHDREGEITAQSSVEVGQDEVKVALGQFVGRIDQVPPAYSAVKVGGKRLYDLARRGVIVEVSPRPVDVYALRLVDWTPPDITLEVECGAGTYVRALARDLGEALGCGAHLTALRRTRSGQFTVEQALSLKTLEAAAAAGDIARHLHPLDAAFAHLPAVHLDDEAAYRLALGQAVPDPGYGGGVVVPADHRQARAYAPGGQFVALVVRDPAASSLQPRRVFVEPAEILAAYPED
jgi:tRNA pseudouridine55 synthase